jgi:hypothetical protein
VFGQNGQFCGSPCTYQENPAGTVFAGNLYWE